MGVNLLTYSAIDGIPTLTDSEVMGLYEQMEMDGTSETVFYDGSVMGAHDFLRTMKHGNTRLFVVSLEREVAGVIWLTDFEARRAAFHFCFFSNAWDSDLVFVGTECVSEILNMQNGSGEPIFDALTGIVPEFNKKAIAWCEKMGFEVLGILPSGCWVSRLQKSVPGTVYFVERGRYGKRI